MLLDTQPKIEKGSAKLLSEIYFYIKKVSFRKNKNILKKYAI